MKRQPRRRGIYLQIEGDGLHRLLLGRRQAGEGVGEGGGDAEFHQGAAQPSNRRGNSGFLSSVWRIRRFPVGNSRVAKAAASSSCEKNPLHSDPATTTHPAIPPD